MTEEHGEKYISYRHVINSERASIIMSDIQSVNDKKKKFRLSIIDNGVYSKLGADLTEQEAIELRDFLLYCYPKEYK